MQSWTFYPAFVATLISIAGWTYFARREHISHMPRTLSELASESSNGLRYYRVVLWICGPLFAITVFAFISPRTSYSVVIVTAAALMIMTEMLVGVFPAQRGKITNHDIIAGAMGSSMIGLAYLFAWKLDGVFALAELILAVVMCVLAACCVIDRKRYLFYELPLIYLSHFSILVAAIALS
jgi:hypothetical protein